MTTTTPILVTGATGKTGRRVAARLAERGVPVRAGSRAADPPFDWTDPGTWDAALEGVTAAYVAYQPDLAVPGADAVIRAFTARAAAAGVRRIVLLSGRGELEAEVCEQIVLGTAGVDATVVRASWFLQNFSEGTLRDAVLAGELALPVPAGVAEAFVDLDDLAEVAAVALTEDGHAGQIYEVTGPAALTFPEVAAILGEAAGRPVQHVDVPLGAFTGALGDMGMAQEEIDLIAYLFTEVLDGRGAAVGDGVQRVLGRAPRAARTWARGAAAAGAWAAAPHGV